MRSVRVNRRSAAAAALNIDQVGGGDRKNVTGKEIVTQRMGTLSEKRREGGREAHLEQLNNTAERKQKEHHI